MNVSILTSGYWPSYPLYEARLPDELTRHQQVFKVGAVSTCDDGLSEYMQHHTLPFSKPAAASHCGGNSGWLCLLPAILQLRCNVIGYPAW